MNGDLWEYLLLASLVWYVARRLRSDRHVPDRNMK